MGMSKTSLQTFGLFLGLAVIVAAAPFLWTLGGAGAVADPGLEIGQTLPVLQGTGAANGPLPSMADLKGKVVVVNCWTTWCPNCHTGMPEHVALYQKYSGTDVVFIGLTSEGEDSRQDIQQFIEKYGIEWPNAYGASTSLVELKAHYIPRYWVFGRDGKVVWNVASRNRTGIGDAIQMALAAQES